MKKIFNKKKINVFVCGITPYDFAHLGHARTYVVFDAFVKYLRTLGHNVFYLQNITDVDDKIINRVKELKKPWKAVSRMFEKEYLKNMKALKVDGVDQYARATDHIPEIISQVKRLLKKGYAYEIKGDGIYYDISKFERYGQLAHRTKEQAQDAISRIDESIQKRNRGDFALWKFSKPGEPKWPSPWGPGRPGWHIEDTSITEKYFGPQYDIHGGGIDLIFPHHEAEVAQMEAISGKHPFVKRWMRTGFLTINGEKMSKSLGNFITINDFLKKHSPRVLRLLFLKTHYRSPIDYSEKLVKQTERELERIDNFVDKITRSSDRVPDRMIGQIRNKFQKALEDDFNTPKAVAVIFELMRANANPKEALAFLKEADKIFGFIFSKQKKESIPVQIKKLVETREKYRKQQNWRKSDQLRNRIKGEGWWVEDTVDGPKIKPL